MKTKVKIVLFAIIMLLAIILLGNSNVQAATYQEANTTVVTENGKVIITENGAEETTVMEVENLEEIIGYKKGSLIMTQANINKFLTPRDISYTVRKKVDNSVTKAELEDGTELEIKTIGNEKWVVYSGIIKYDAYDIGKGWDSCIVGYKNDDIYSVTIGDEGLGYYLNGNKNDIFDGTLWNVIGLETEKTAGAQVYYTMNFVNERNISYENIGGKGGFVMGYTKLHPIYDLTKFSDGLISMVPAKADLSKVYLKLNMSAYQGESIVLKNGKGTLYYEGKENSMYVYKNKVSNLKIKENEIAEFSYKLTNGYELDGHFNTVYRLDSNAIETVVKVEDSTKNEQQIDNKVGISYWGDASFNIAKVEKTDSIYTRVENEINRELPKNKRILHLDILDIYRVSGDFGGKLTITFDVDEKYNGKHYYVSHYTGLGEYESFSGEIANGKITITVSSLSPFGIAIYEEETATKPVDKGEKDETPPTGTMNIVGYVLATTILAGVGIVAVKKNLK